jgi:hypothetical protein
LMRRRISSSLRRVPPKPEVHPKTSPRDNVTAGLTCIDGSYRVLPLFNSQP